MKFFIFAFLFVAVAVAVYAIPVPQLEGYSFDVFDSGGDGSDGGLTDTIGDQTADLNSVNDGDSIAPDPTSQLTEGIIFSPFNEAGESFGKK